jgi:PIN domain nuclease of toxin-antitoxin system
MSDLSLDTHVLLWAVATPHRLAAGVRSLIENRRYAASVDLAARVVSRFWRLGGKLA